MVGAGARAQDTRPAIQADSTDLILSAPAGGKIILRWGDKLVG